jgi:tetratricopeptide (TPR) repeat protein
LPAMTNFNVRGLPSIFRALGGLWGKLLGSLTALCLLASILYGGWRGWTEPAIVIDSFHTPALTPEGHSLAFTGDNAADEMSKAFMQLREEAEGPLYDSRLEDQLRNDSEPLELVSFGFSRLPVIVVRVPKEESLLSGVSLARQIFHNETQLTGDVETTDSMQLQFSIVEHNFHTWEGGQKYPNNSQGLRMAAKDLAEQVLAIKNPGLLAAALFNENRKDESNKLLDGQSDPSLRLERAQILMMTGRSRPALELLDELIKSDQNQFGYISTLLAASASIDAAKFEDALRYLNRSFPGSYSTAVLSLQGRLFWKQGNKERALQYFTQAACAPGSATFLDHLSFHERCVADPIAWFNLAWAHAHASDSAAEAKASEICEKGLQYFPKEPKLLLLKARIEKCKSISQAEEDLARVVNLPAGLVQRVATRESLAVSATCGKETADIHKIDLNIRDLQIHDGNIAGITLQQ